METLHLPFPGQGTTKLRRNSQGAGPRGLLGAMELCQGPKCPDAQVLDLSVLGHPGVGSREFNAVFLLWFFVVYANK